MNQSVVYRLRALLCVNEHMIYIIQQIVDCVFLDCVYIMHVCFIYIITANITVGYERTLYTTPEGDTEVELCVVIYKPPSGGTPRSFVLSYSTADGTASEYLKKECYYDHNL